MILIPWHLIILKRQILVSQKLLIISSFFKKKSFICASVFVQLQIGLHGWDSLLDANGLSPCAYAQMRNNHSYNALVARKLVDRKNGQVSVPVGDEIQEQSLIAGQIHQASFQIRQGQKSCSKCAVGAARYNRKTSASQGLLHRPYIHSMLAIAAVCVCVCLFLRGAPDIGLVAPFKWENLGYGAVQSVTTIHTPFLGPRPIIVVEIDKLKKSYN